MSKKQRKITALDFAQECLEEATNAYALQRSTDGPDAGTLAALSAAASQLSAAQYQQRAAEMARASALLQFAADPAGELTSTIRRQALEEAAVMLGLVEEEELRAEEEPRPGLEDWLAERAAAETLEETSGK